MLFSLSNGRKKEGQPLNVAADLLFLYRQMRKEKLNGNAHMIAYARQRGPRAASKAINGNDVGSASRDHGDIMDSVVFFLILTLYSV